MSRFDLTFTNRLSGARLRAIGDSVAENGVLEPIKFVRINGVNFVVDGNHRLALAFRFGLNRVPVQEVSLPYRGFRNSTEVIDSAVPTRDILNSSQFRFYRRRY